MNVNLINLLQVKIGYFLAYFPTICLGGFLQALINKKLGDDTAENEGFLTLDPAIHFDPFGFFFLMFPWQLLGIDTDFGFGKKVPINVDNIFGKFKNLRKGLLLFSGSIAFFISTILFISLFVLSAFLINNFNLKISSLGNLGFALNLFAQSIISLSIFLFIVYAVISVVNLILYLSSPDSFLKRNQFVIFLMIIIVGIALTDPLRILMYYLLQLIFG